MTIGHNQPSEPGDRSEPANPAERHAVKLVMTQLCLILATQWRYEFKNGVGFYHPKNERLW